MKNVFKQLGLFITFTLKNALPGADFIEIMALFLILG